eukprot:PhM_4_TR8766/c1_g2_i1/m.37115
MSQQHFRIRRQIAALVTTRLFDIFGAKSKVFLAAPNTVHTIEDEVDKELRRHNPNPSVVRPLPQATVDSIVRRLKDAFQPEIAALAPVTSGSPLPAHLSPAPTGVSIFSDGSRARQLRTIASDAEWSAKAMEDTANAMIEQQKELEQRRTQRHNQAEFLRQQVEEKDRERERERQELLKTGREVVDSVNKYKQDTNDHKQQERDKMKQEWHELMSRAATSVAQREEMMRIRHEEERKWHSEIRSELRSLEEKKLQDRTKAKREFDNVLEEARLSMKEKERLAMEEKRMDKEFQRMYEETLDKQAAERSAAKQRVQNKMSMIQSKALEVAGVVQARAQNDERRIEEEYERQTRAHAEKEDRIAARRRQEALDAAAELKRQMKENDQRRKDQLRKERDDARRLDRAMQTAAAREMRQRQLRREAELRRMEFLESQVKVKHLKQTMPMETQIMRKARGPGEGAMSQSMDAAAVSLGLSSLSVGGGGGG